jgi:hypothetical protein
MLVRLRHLALALASGAIAAFVCYLRLASGGQSWAWDLSWPLRGASVLLTLHNPYASDLPYRDLSPFPRYWPLYYPLPALVTVAPLSWLPMPLAGALFAGVSSALLAYGAGADPKRLLLFLSYPYWTAIIYVQWAPLLSAALFLPMLAPLAFCKPNVGLPILLARPPHSWRGWFAITLSALLLLASVPLGWLMGTRSHENFTPLMVLPLGPLVLLALLRWRDPRARLLLAMAAMPQRSADGLALLTIPASRRSALLMTLVGWVPLLLTGWDASPRAVLLCLYLPALLCLFPRQQRRYGVEGGALRVGKKADLIGGQEIGATDGVCRDEIHPIR